jgi:CRP-like cAMP-binding protein
MILETRHSIPELLSRQPVFRGMSRRGLLELAAHTHEYRVARQELLFQKGDAARAMYLVVTGQVKLFLPSESGVEKVVHMAEPGESFGEESLFLDRSYPVGAEASKDSIILAVDKAPLMEQVARTPTLAQAMIDRLSTRFIDLVGSLESCVQKNSTERVADFLIQRAPAEAASFAFQLDTDKQTVASQLNLAPETLSRVLGRLAKAGYIHVHGRSITVMDAGALRGYAGA